MAERLLIGIEPTRHCNLRCLHCLRADTDTREEISLDLLGLVLDQIHAYGRPHIALTGGEPTLHEHFIDILAMIQEHQFTCHFVTNGSTFPKLASALRAFRGTLLSISFSVDGATEATHDRIRGRGSFRRVLLAIALARHEGWGVTIQLAINRLNRCELGRLPELAATLGAQRLFFCHTQPTVALYRAGYALAPTEWQAVEEETRALARSGKGVPPRLSTGLYDPGKVAPCPALQSKSLNIDFRGRLTLCCQLSGVADETRRGDVVADLSVTPLALAHQLLLPKISEVLSERVALFADKSTCDLDGFQCWHCHKRFGKLDWMTHFADDPWVAADPFFSSASEPSTANAMGLRRRS